MFIIPAAKACFQFFLIVSKKSLKPKECLSLAVFLATWVIPTFARPDVSCGKAKFPEISEIGFKENHKGSLFGRVLRNTGTLFIVIEKTE